MRKCVILFICLKSIAMEERAAERERLKRAREEKRRKEEEEKLVRFFHYSISVLWCEIIMVKKKFSDGFSNSLRTLCQAMLLAEEEERKQRDEEEKRKRIEAHREKKRLEKQVSCLMQAKSKLDSTSSTTTNTRLQWAFVFLRKEHFWLT